MVYGICLGSRVVVGDANGIRIGLTQLLVLVIAPLPYPADFDIQSLHDVQTQLAADSCAEVRGTYRVFVNILNWII